MWRLLEQRGKKFWNWLSTNRIFSIKRIRIFFPICMEISFLNIIWLCETLYILRWTFILMFVNLFSGKLVISFKSACLSNFVFKNCERCCFCVLDVLLENIAWNYFDLKKKWTLFFLLKFYWAVIYWIYSNWKSKMQTT